MRNQEYDLAHHKAQLIADECKRLNAILNRIADLDV